MPESIQPYAGRVMLFEVKVAFKGQKYLQIQYIVFTYQSKALVGYKKLKAACLI